MMEYYRINQVAVRRENYREEWGFLEYIPNYAISNKGRVVNVVFGSIVVPNSYSSSYPPRIKLVDQYNISRHFLVRRLVAERFLSAFEHVYDVSNKDGNFENNQWTNLSFCDGNVGYYVPGNEQIRVRYLKMIFNDGRVEFFNSVIAAQMKYSLTSRSVYDCLDGARETYADCRFEWSWEESMVGTKHAYIVR